MLKIILTALFAALAVFAGLFVAVLAAGTGMAVSLFKRWQSRRRGDRPASLPRPAAVRRRARPSDGDVIDVTATEVPADPANR